jgi:hypothetical protein
MSTITNKIALNAPFQQGHSRKLVCERNGIVVFATKYNKCTEIDDVGDTTYLTVIWPITMLIKGVILSTPAQ